MNKNSLSGKIILMVEFILLISSILFCTVSIYRARIGIRKAIQQRMLDIANCASGSVNGDILKDIYEDDIGSPEYNKVYNTLSVFRDNVELEYVYSLREESEGNFTFIMDTDPVDPAPYGGSTKCTNALSLAGKGIAAVDEVPYSDAWGEFYSAYSPVMDSTGKVAGIVAVDFSADWFEGQLSAQTWSTVGSYVVILFLTLLLAAVLSMLTVRPFVRMQGQLLEEKVRAESANNAKSDFLANMSHEIRTPINAVLGMNEMILREDRRVSELPVMNEETVKEAFKNIDNYAMDVKKAGHNLLAIVNDILDFSKIEAGRFDITEAPYGLSSLVNDLNNMILFKAQDKDLEFNIEVDPTLPNELCGDELRNRQIFTNLLNNAVKYTQEGSILFKLDGERTEEGMLMLKAVVRDTGIGIKAEDLEKLFTKFERLEMKHNSTVEGTGLGLVITKALVDMMGGTISVESEYRKGSTFTVMIPQKIISDVPVGDLQERFKANNPENEAYRETFHAPDAHILIVDDTRINLTVVVNLLKNTEMNIDTATSGAKAVVMAERTGYDLILMDQRMPEMNGTEALNLIRGNPGSASNRSPIICLTADAVMGAKDKYISEGFTDYLTKPIRIASLEKMLMKYLPEKKVERIQEDIRAARAKENEGKEDYAPLIEAGVDPQTGLKYSQNDDMLYKTLLSEYAAGMENKAENLNSNLRAKDWDTYSIYVHSLKSTSKMIGATALSEQAARLEAASSDKDVDTILAEHDSMMEKYKAVARAIFTMIPEAESQAARSGAMEFKPTKGVVLEFNPK